MLAFRPVQAWSIVGVAQAPANDREGANDITGANAPDLDHNNLGIAMPVDLRSASKNIEMWLRCNISILEAEVYSDSGLLNLQC